MMKHTSITFGFCKQYRLTAIMAVLGGFYLLAAHAYNIDFFEYLIGIFHQFLKATEPYEGDEALAVLVLVGAGVLGDMVRQRRQARHVQALSAERIETMQSTMGDVQNVVNNFLNNLQLFRFEAERSGALDDDQLQQFDNLISQTAQKLKAIDDGAQMGGDQGAESANFKGMKS